MLFTNIYFCNKDWTYIFVTDNYFQFLEIILFLKTKVLNVSKDTFSLNSKQYNQEYKHDIVQIECDVFN